MRNVDQREAQRYLITLADGLAGLLNDGVHLFVLPPATLLPAMSEVARKTSIRLGAQNFHWEEEGVFTGELSTELLKDAGATVLMVGHAERRVAGTENSVRLIYGGNVNLSNCREIASVSGIDGLFVGGAAADPPGFISVIGRALDGAANQADFARERYLMNREKE